MRILTSIQLIVPTFLVIYTTALAYTYFTKLYSENPLDMCFEFMMYIISLFRMVTPRLLQFSQIITAENMIFSLTKQYLLVVNINYRR